MAEITIYYNGPIVSREEALAARLKYYFTAQPCLRNHLDQRLTKGFSCLRCSHHSAKLSRWNKNRKDAGLQPLIRICPIFRISAHPVTKHYSGTITTRAAAIAAGQTFYFTGKPCKHGHVDIRYIYNSNCSQCHAIMQKRFPTPRAKRNELSRSWSARNPHKIKEYRERGHTRYLEYMKEYRKAKPEITKASYHRRRAREVNAPGSHTAADLKRLLKLQNYKCGNCGCKFSKNLKPTLDHKIPLFKGGSNDPENLEYLCLTCNSRKNTKDPITWARENGRLI